MNQSTLNRKSKSKYHQQSLDNIMKQIRKINLKSERHLSPKPPLYMYSKNQNTHHTLQRSRSISNRRSNSKKSKKTIRKNVQKILENKIDDVNENPGNQIERYCELIKKVQKTLKRKSSSSLSLYLCQKFQEMLSSIVENMLTQLNHRIKELQQTIQKKVQEDLTDKFDIKEKGLQKYILKLQFKTKQLLQKQNFNNQIIYELRRGNWLNQQVDIDRVFRKLNGIQPSDIHGYRQENQQNIIMDSSNSESIEYPEQDRIRIQPQKSQTQNYVFQEF